LEGEVGLEEVNTTQSVITGSDDEVVLDQKAFGIIGGRLVPKSYFLSSAYPNPFNYSTIIKYGLPFISRTKVVIYDVNGRQVKRLIDGEQKAGYYTIAWNGRNTSNQEVSTGLYFCRLKSNGFTKTIKLTLVK